MKRLYIVRNAHAAVGAIDRERELDEQGKQELASIGTQMVARGMRPSIILTSGARRAIDTAKHIREVFGLLVNVIDIREELYTADLEKIREILQLLPDEKNSVMIIAHNDGVTKLLESITDGEYKDFPNAGMAVIELRLRHWNELDSSSGREIAFLRPELAEAV